MKRVDDRLSMELEIRSSDCSSGQRSTDHKTTERSVQYGVTPGALKIDPTRTAWHASRWVQSDFVARGELHLHVSARGEASDLWATGLVARAMSRSVLEL